MVVARLLQSAIVAMMLTALAHAGALSVAPTTANLTYPDASALFTLRNDSNRAISVQIRVFDWTQNDGGDVYRETGTVVASPPFTRIEPHASYVTRVVRTSKRPVSGEEAYRVMIDEVPERSRESAGTINFVMRHSIPVFFSQSDAAPGKLTWMKSPGGGLQVSNEGDMAIKLSDLKVVDGGRPVATVPGLVGYVLGRSKMSIDARSLANLSGANLHVQATDQFKTFEAKVR